MAEPNYPGNSSLPPEIQQRVAGTFRQSLDLAAKGSLREAQLGCDFVLGLDPEFHLARKLADLLALADGPVDVSELAAELSPGAPPPPLAPKLAELLAAREFEQLLALATSNRTQVEADPELQRLVAVAQERLEAEPYLQPFFEQARAAAAAGRREEAERALAKARTLDPEHPELARIAQLIAAPPAPEPAAGFLIDDELELGSPAFESAPLAPIAASGALETGGDARIDDLLREGQAAFDRGEYQEAIDSWSRIFLVDIDHREASRLVDLARQRKAEVERQLEEIFHEAVMKYEAGDAAEAREGFERVLAAQPGFYAAREYLSLLDADEDGAAPAAAPGLISVVPSEAGPESHSAHEIFTPPDIPESEPIAPPRTVAPPAFDELAPARRAGRSGRNLFAFIGGGVLLLLVAGGLWLWQSWDRLFPNSQPPPAAGQMQPGASDPIAKARKAYSEGRIPSAIALLRKVPESSEHYAEAQSLIQQWEALAPTPAAPVNGDGPSPEQLARRQQWLDRAGRELASGERVRALFSFEQAAKIAALDGEAATTLATLTLELEPLAAELDLRRHEEWELLLNNLWRRREESGRSPEIDRLMVDAYFNLGLRDLLRSEPAAAAGKFEEGLAIDPRDEELQRFARFARTYQERNEDLLFRIFVKYAPQR